jgi:16S rRNA (cytosine967-C5)-methyltransferase
VTLVARPGLADAERTAAQTGGRLGRWSPYAVVLPGGDPGALAGVRAGRLAVQDEGSQLAALALVGASVDGSDARWLDLCAGPGGKAALLGALATDRGARVVANEISAHRVRLVQAAVRGLADTVVVRAGDGRQAGTVEPGAYDRVLVDAPCTAWARCVVVRRPGGDARRATSRR